MAGVWVSVGEQSVAMSATSWPSGCLRQAVSSRGHSARVRLYAGQIAHEHMDRFGVLAARSRYPPSHSRLTPGSGQRARSWLLLPATLNTPNGHGSRFHRSETFVRSLSRVLVLFSADRWDLFTFDHGTIHGDFRDVLAARHLVHDVAHDALEE